jgi:hypothetical protein
MPLAPAFPTDGWACSWQGSDFEITIPGLVLSSPSRLILHANGRVSFIVRGNRSTFPAALPRDPRTDIAVGQSGAPPQRCAYRLKRFKAIVVPLLMQVLLDRSDARRGSRMGASELSMADAVPGELAQSRNRWQWIQVCPMHSDLPHARQQRSNFDCDPACPHGRGADETMSTHLCAFCIPRAALRSSSRAPSR